MELLNKEPVLEDIERITAGLEAVMEEQEVPIGMAMRFSIAIDEVYSNIVYYSGATNARVEYDITREYVKLCFSDNGSPYDPLAKEDPDVEADIDERVEGGLGIFMVKQFMDEMTYERVGDRNVLTLMANIPKEEQ